MKDPGAISPAMKVSLIAALADNGTIGKDNALPWHLPDDFKWFKKMTLGKPVIMGRRTWESIGSKPLPGRKNIVLTHSPSSHVRGVEMVFNLQRAVECAGREDEAVIIGGARLYKEALPIADLMYLTRVHADLEGDTFFPEVDWNQWERLSSEAHAADERHAYAFTCETWKRRR
jgi:dihydrofolate reductase